MNGTNEEKILLATALAMELAKGLDDDEIAQLRNFINQISYSLSSLLQTKK